MNRLFPAVAAILLSAMPLFPQTPSSDLSIAIDAPAETATGSRIDIVVTASNKGPAEAPTPTVHLASGQLLFTSLEAPGWQCSFPWDSVAMCWKENMEVGSETLRFRALTRNTAGPAMLGVVLSAAVNDSNSSNNRIDHNFMLNAAAASSDLQIVAAPQVVPATPGRVPISLPIRNAGPDASGKVHLFALWSGTQTVAGVSAGWSCDIVNQKIHCTTASIAAGQTSDLRFTLDEVPSPTQLHLGLSLLAEQTTDPNVMNNQAGVAVTIGVPADFARVLLPVVTPEIAGAYGSRWVTEFSVFADTEASVAIFPEGVGDCRITCPPIPPFGDFLPRRRTHRPRLDIYPQQPNPGYLLYFERKYEPALAFQLRVRDLSRELSTWGTEIPVVHEDKFLSGRTELLDIPARSGFRQFLRIYDPFARGGSVIVRLFGVSPNGETLVGERTVALEVPPDNDKASPLALPVRPAYAQLLLADVFPNISAFQTVRVEVEPQGEALRYWAFVSVTNNDTQHVTTVTPQ